MSQACIIYYALCTLCTRRVPAARTPTTHHTSAACARERRCREKHARRSHESVTVAPSGLLRERRLWSCAVNCAATPRRSCMRQQLESSRTASRPTHPLLARGSRARDCLTPVETSACCAARREARGSALHDRNVASPTSSYEAAPATRRMVHAERSREQAVWNALRVSVAFQTPRRTPKVAVKRPHCEQKIIAGERFFLRARRIEAKTVCTPPHHVGRHGRRRAARLARFT